MKDDARTTATSLPSGFVKFWHLKASPPGGRSNGTLATVISFTGGGGGAVPVGTGFTVPGGGGVVPVGGGATVPVGGGATVPGGTTVGLPVGNGAVGVGCGFPVPVGAGPVGAGGGPPGGALHVLAHALRLPLAQ